jgi:hypothetical protein
MDFPRMLPAGTEKAVSQEEMMEAVVIGLFGVR